MSERRMVEERKMAEALRARADVEIEAGAPLFMRWPERWFDGKKSRCVNGHVSTTVLKSEAKGGDVCLQCGEFVNITFPEDEDGPLDEMPTIEVAR